MRTVIWNKKLRTYLHEVGDLVLVSNPHDQVMVKTVVVEQVMPLEFPRVESYEKPEDLIYLPRTRVRGQACRKESYIVKTRGVEPGQAYLWVSKDCIKAGEG